MNRFKTWLTTIAVLWCSITTSAHDFEVGGIYYNITSTTSNTVSVTYYGEHSIEAVYTGHIEIPSSVSHNGVTYSVTGIGDKAFNMCNITGVTIPNSVTSIGEEAFFYCSNLTQVIIPNSVTTIGKAAFMGFGITSIVVPSSVTTIGDLAFCCRNLKKVEWNHFTIEELYGFGMDSEPLLEEVILGDNVKTIGDYAFKFCRNLKSVTISNSVTTIGESAFEYCI